MMLLGTNHVLVAINSWTIRELAVDVEVLPYCTVTRYPQKSWRVANATRLISRNGLSNLQITIIHIVIVYRPPYCEEHRATTASFFDEFAKYIQTKLLSNQDLLVLGDFSIHMDVLNNKDALKLMDLLVCWCRSQHVKDPIHIHGHTLDLVICGQSNNIIWGTPFC